jgi:bifunctional polynucleotide phosphatase/kinase
MIYEIKSPRFRSKLAMFDYDWTLAKPKSNSPFPKDVDDWQWLTSRVPAVLRELYASGYAIHIFTNQSKEWKHTQIINALKEVDIPITVTVATAKAQYKPNIALFERTFEDHIGQINKTDSFFCGDALGRHGDYADSDRRFAENIGVCVITPEEMFSVAEPVQEPVVEPSDTQEVVIMVGYPASGKSTISAHLAQAGYYVASGDSLKTSAKMIKAAETQVRQGKSVVFDATNPTIEKRAEYVEFAKKHGLPVRCIHVATPIEVAQARNGAREHPVPKIVYNVYRKRFEPPTEAEGFQLVTTGSL